MNCYIIDLLRTKGDSWSRLYNDVISYIICSMCGISYFIIDMCRKLSAHDNWSQLAVHVALDMVVVIEDISESCDPVVCPTTMVTVYVTVVITV